MASLYEIDQAIQACVDSETGEIIDPEQLDRLVMDRNQKIENVVLWVKNLMADSAAYKAEMETFAARKKEADTKVESLKRWLEKATGGEKYSSARCAVSWRSSEAVEVLEETSIPKKYMVKVVSLRPDKKAIKEAIKAGAKVKGVQLVKTRDAQIK